MALLFIQTKELRKIYEGKQIVKKRCYLVDKNWINNFKNSYNYKDSVTTFNSFKEWKNYDDFKSKIIKFIQINEEDLNSFKKDIDNNFEIKRQMLNNIEYPVDFELVNSQFFIDCKINVGFPLCTVFIGNKSIFVIEDKNCNTAYHCSPIEGSKNDDNNFLIKANSILAFNVPNILNENINTIISKGINKFLKELNININSNNQQSIIFNNNNIGFFINLINNSQLNNQNINNNNPSGAPNPQDKNNQQNINFLKDNQMQNQFTNNNQNMQNFQFQNDSQNNFKTVINKNYLSRNQGFGNNNNNYNNNIINNNRNDKNKVNNNENAETPGNQNNLTPHQIMQLNNNNQMNIQINDTPNPNALLFNNNENSNTKINEPSNNINSKGNNNK
jgi:hypothetical protein